MCVCVCVQTCVDVLESLRRGDFGQVTQETIDEYRTQCHAIFPYANAFMLDMPNGTVDEIVGHSDTAAAATDTDCVDGLA